MKHTGLEKFVPSFENFQKISKYTWYYITNVVTLNFCPSSKRDETILDP